MIPEKLLMNNRRIARKKKKQQNNSQISFAIVGWLFDEKLLFLLFIYSIHTRKKNHNRSTGVSYAPYIYKDIIHHYHTDTRTHTHTQQMNESINDSMMVINSSKQQTNKKNQITQT